MWHLWSEWSQCSSECGAGTQKRTRTWRDEMYGGDPCEGEREETKECFPKHCPSKFPLVYHLFITNKKDYFMTMLQIEFFITTIL